MNKRTRMITQAIVIAFVVAGILFLAIGGYLTPVIRVAMTPFINTQTWIAERYTAVTDFLAAPSDTATLRQRNLELEAEAAQLRAQVIELQQQNAEIQLLSALLDFARSNPGADYLAANVIGRDVSPFLHYIIINRGSDDGLRRGMPVVTSQGLVGRIAAVTAGAARVQLITDPSSTVNVKLQSSGENAVLIGSVTGDISLNLIPPNVLVTSGELVLSSGLGGNFPDNILIGQVVSVRSRSSDLFQTASIQPLTDFAQLEIVLVIQNFRPVDITPLIP